MINWFLNLDTSSQAAVIVAILGLIGSVAVAIMVRVSKVITFFCLAGVYVR